MNTILRSVIKLLNAPCFKGRKAIAHVFGKKLFLFALVTFASVAFSFGQAPTISYSGPQTYAVGTTITPLSPSGSNIAAQAYNPTPVTLAPGLQSALSIAVDAAGTVYAADNAAGVVHTIPAGGGTPGTIGSFTSPLAVATDGAGNIYVSDRVNQQTNSCIIYKIQAGGGSQAPLFSGFGIFALAADAAGNVYFANTADKNVYKLTAGGTVPVSIASGFNNLLGIAADAAGNVYTADLGADLIQKIPFGGGPISTLSSKGASGIAVDAGGNLYISSDVSLLELKPASNYSPTTLITNQLSLQNVAIDASGNVYTASTDLDNPNSPYTVLKVKPNGGYYASDFLTAGLVLDANTGIISGTPTMVTAAANYTVTAYNSAGLSTTALVNIGVVVAPASPTTAATALTFTGTTTTATTANWTNGNGTARAVFMAAATSGSPAPANLTAYNANAAFGSGDQIGSTGWYCVYNGAGSTVSITGLTAGATYRAMVVEYNGTGSNLVYLTAAGTGNPTGVTTLTPTTSFATTISALTTTTGTASSSARFYIYGSSLTAGNLTVTAPAGFDISADNATWSNSGGNITIAETGTLMYTPVYIRLDAADAVNTYSGNVTISGGGAPDATEATASSAVVAVPTISYTTPQIYNTGTPVTLTPTSSGVAAQAYSSTPVTLGSGFSDPFSVAVDAAGNVYVADYANSAIKEIPAGNGAPITLGSGFNLPEGVAVDLAGNVYVADSHNAAVKEIPAGNGTPIILGSGFNFPTSIAVDAAGNVYVTDSGNNAVKEIPAGNGTPITLGSGFSHPQGIAVDAAGNVYVGDSGNNAVKEIPAGNGTPFIIGSGFSNPVDVAVDAGGNVYVADNGNKAVKEIPAGNGTPVILSSGFSDLYSVVADAVGNLYVADVSNNAVKELTPIGGYYITPFLPAGLILNSNTGVISGTPTAASAAKNYMVTAYNSTGTSTNTIVNIGVTLVPPTTAATGLVFTATTVTSTTANWTPGNGTSRAVFMAAVTSGSPAPVNLTAYSANSAFGKGTQIGTTGWYCVYNGNNSNTVNITGLIGSVTYQAMVVEYNGMGSVVDYLTAPGTGNPASVTTILGPPVISSFSPASGPPGTVVTITGSEFNTTAANNIVFFGATMATVTSASLTSLTVTVPAGATYAPITVLNGANHLSGYSSLPFVVTFSGAGGITTSTFSAPQKFTTGNAPQAVAIADIDGDGKPDIVVVNKTDNTMGVFLNTSVSGSITATSFAAEKTFSTVSATSPIFIAIGDLDGDGKPDVVTAGTSVSVFHNTSTPGNISFDPRISISIGGITPRAIAIADFDGR